LPYIASISTISATSNFFALGDNTTLLSHVLDQMRSKFRETLMLTDLVHNPTLRGMTTVAMNKTSIFSLGGTAIDWKAETSLPMISREKIDSEKVKTGQNMVVLLTSATGFCECAILGCLITAPDVLLIHCIAIRSPDEVTQHEKVVNHTGNLTQPCFGTSQSDWRQLVVWMSSSTLLLWWITCVHTAHCAPPTFFQPRSLFNSPRRTTYQSNTSLQPA
jgi:hypothetical protein